MFRTIALLIFLIPSIAHSAASNRPSEVMGAGGEKCSSFAVAVDMLDTQLGLPESDRQDLTSLYALIGEYQGTLFGFLSASMMQHGDKAIPFESSVQAMQLALEKCHEQPDARFIDIVWNISNTSFGRPAEP